MKSHLKYRQNGGYILLLTLVFGAVMLLTLSSLVNYVVLDSRISQQAVAYAQAQALADAGIDRAVYELNQNGSYTGESNVVLPTGTFTTTITTVNSTTKRITSTGYVPNATSPISTHAVHATASINSSIVSFHFGVQVGDGGLVINNGAQVIGNVYTNGPISGGGSVTGDATVAGAAAGSLDQQQTTQNTGTNVGDTSSRIALAQSFTPTVSGNLTNVSLYLNKTGNPADLTVMILSDNLGTPSTTILASATVASTTVTSSYAYVNVAFSPTATVTAGQRYWIVPVVSGVSMIDYYAWGMNSAGGYSGGSAKYSQSWNASPPVWFSLTGDFTFNTYVSAYGSITGVSIGGNASAHTLSNCSVGGKAYYQSISGCPVSGTQYPGSTDPSSSSLPISNTDIANWENIAASGGTLTGPYSVSGAKTLGPVKINGDLSVNNGASLIVAGPIWVNGNVTFGNNSSISVAQSAGSSGAALIADATGNTATKGIITMSNNMTTSGNGNSGSYIMMLSTNSGSSAIQLNNNVASVVLYASQGTIQVNNGAGANELVGYGINLGNNSTVTYSNGLQNQSFSNGPGGSWMYVPGSYAITQ